MIDPVPPYVALVAPVLGRTAPAALRASRRQLVAASDDLDGVRKSLRRGWEGGAATAAARCLDRRAGVLDATDAELACAEQLLGELAAAQVVTAEQADRVMSVWWAATTTLPGWTPALQVLRGLVVGALHAVRAEHRQELSRLTAAFDRLTTGARSIDDVQAGDEGMPVTPHGTLPCAPTPTASPRSRACRRACSTSSTAPG